MRPIKEPSFKDLNLYRLVYGTTITPKKRIESFDPDVYEDFIACWLLIKKDKASYSKIGREEKYEKISNIGGAGDKGRDVIAYVSSEKSMLVWDNYQCKHYSKPLAPTDVYVELGKVMYYTFRGDYTIPRKYFFVAPKGIGRKLGDMLDSPKLLKKSLIENWKDYCEKHITKSQDVTLDDEFGKYVREFDYTLFNGIGTHQILKDFEGTKYFAYFFGGGLSKPRLDPKEPTEKIDDNEANYIACLLEAYSEHKNEKIVTLDELRKFEFMYKHFQRQRIDFYKAESLKNYANETLPTNEAFEKLKDMVYDGIIETVEDDYEDGYRRLKQILKDVVNVQLTANVLDEVTEPSDRKGMCHQLANEKRVRWVLKNE